MQTLESCIHQVFLIFLFLTVYFPGHALTHLVSELHEPHHPASNVEVF